MDNQTNRTPAEKNTAVTNTDAGEELLEDLTRFLEPLLLQKYNLTMQEAMDAVWFNWTGNYSVDVTEAKMNALRNYGELSGVSVDDAVDKALEDFLDVVVQVQLEELQTKTQGRA